MPGYNHLKWSYSMFLCMLKINFIIHFFLTILHFKESCNFIGPKLETQNYARYVGEISITILVFIIDYFIEKYHIIFQKKSQKPYFGRILDTFAQIGYKNEFFWKKGSFSFSIFELPTIVPKFRNTIPEPFLRKLLERHTKNQFIIH